MSQSAILTEKPDSTLPSRPDWVRATWYLLGLTLAIRIGYLLIFPLDLAPDESYYWDWSRHPDWSYYSKPPLVAWVIWLGTTLGNTPFFVKLPAALLNVASIAILAALARRMYSAKAGFWTALISVTMPGTAVGGMTMTIDAPLLFCWAVALWFTWLTFDSQNSPKSRFSAGAGTAIAVGTGLIAKLSMGAFWISPFLLYLFPGKDKQRPSLAKWISLAIASGLFLIPFLLWNWKRDWITFKHTSSSFGLDEDQWDFNEAFLKGLEFVSSQLGALNPVWWVALLILGFICMRYWNQLDRRARFLTAFSYPCVFGSLLLAFYQRVQPNWPAAFYLAATILLGAWIAGDPLGIRPIQRPFSRTWKKIGTILGIITVLFLYLAPFIWQATGYAGHRSDPFARIRGWQAFATEVERVRQEDFAEKPHFIWVAGHRYPTSQLAFYLPDQPTVFRYDPSGLIWSQYEMWPTPQESGLAGNDALLLLPKELVETQLPEWSLYFEQVSPLGVIEYEIGNGRRHSMLAFRGKNLLPKLTQETSVP